MHEILRRCRSSPARRCRLKAGAGRMAQAKRKFAKLKISANEFLAIIVAIGEKDALE